MFDSFLLFVLIMNVVAGIANGMGGSILIDHYTYYVPLSPLF
jgi:hypothetical protein